MLCRKKLVGKRQLQRRVAAGVRTILTDIQSSVNINKNSSTFEVVRSLNSDKNKTILFPQNLVQIPHVSHCNAEDCFNNDIISNIEEIPRDSVPNQNIRTKLANWVNRKHVPHSVVNNLLDILVPYHPELPLDCRTLLGTPKNLIEKKLETGSYCHIGLKCGLDNLFSKLQAFPDSTIKISVNIDGLPVFRSKNIQLWPILCLVKNIQTSPFAVGIFCGTSKPQPLDAFLEDFVCELNNLLDNGYSYNGSLYHIVIHSFICDAPARAYVKGIKSHGGYSACDKCFEVGEYHGRIIYAGINATRRSDQSFLLQQDEDHHIRLSPLIKLKNIGMVSSFPIDYMHAVLLGVTRKLLNTWVSGNLSVRLSHRLVSQISSRLENFKQFIPIEFNRKTRSLAELAHWKATEYRTFLVYLGIVALKGIVDLAIYEHFLLLHCAITIFLSAKHISTFGTDMAANFLNVFIKHSRKIYGIEFLVYNVHVLCHLKDDVEKFGPLDNFSSFPFENYLKDLKKLIRSPLNPLAQVCRRLKENSVSSDCNNLFQKSSQHVWLHTTGPLFTGLDVHKQFKKFVFQGFSFCSKTYSSADSYFISKDHKVIQIENIIIDSKHNTHIIGKQFMQYRNYYDYPIESSLLDIYVVKIQSDTNVWSSNDILTKCLLVPYNSDSEWVCFSLLQ